MLKVNFEKHTHKKKYIIAFAHIKLEPEEKNNSEERKTIKRVNGILMPLSKYYTRRTKGRPP